MRIRSAIFRTSLAQSISDNNLLQGVRRWLEPLPKAVENAHIPGIYANLCVIWVNDLPEVRTSTELGLLVGRVSSSFS